MTTCDIPGLLYESRACVFCHFLRESYVLPAEQMAILQQAGGSVMTVHMPLTTFTRFGDLLRFLRRRLRLSQRDLAIAVGYSESHLSRIEAGERPLDRTSLLALFVPALSLQDEPETVERLLELIVDRATIQPATLHVSAPTAADQGRLPAPLTSFIGRDEEMTAICALLVDRRIRLLTLTGPVGVGKTRLALAVGKRLLTAYQHGVYLIELAPVRDHRLVPAVIGRGLGVHEVRQQPMEQTVSAFLAPRETLLIVDNLEHLLPASAFLTALLTACPGVQILVTSRARLHVYGEYEYVVPPLPVSEPGDMPAAADSPAVRLFCERARATQTAFHLTPSLTPTIADICRRLDGLPLAIELVAARIRLFAPQELLQQLERRLPLLSQIAADTSERQELDRAVGWSYGLLTPTQQALFARLSVFSGSFSLAAAEAVYGDSGPGSNPVPEQATPSLAHDIAVLMDQSLLARQIRADTASHSGACCLQCPTRRLREQLEAEPRFSMLSIIREFARNRLVTSSELPRIEQRYAAYFATWAEEAATHLYGPAQDIWMARLEQETDNLRSALGWLIECGLLETAARLACALGVFWQRHGHYSEGRGWLEQLIAQTAHRTLPDGLHAQMLQTAAMLAYRQGNWQTARHELGECLVLYQSAADDRGVARAFFDLGWIALDRAEWHEAIRLNQESLALARETGDETAVYRALTNLGWARLCLGSRDSAGALFQEAYALAGQLGHTRGVAVSLVNLSWIAFDSGAYEEAHRMACQSLRLCHALGEREVLAEGLDLVAAVAVTRGEVRRASVIAGAAETLWEALHVIRPPTLHAILSYARSINALQRRLMEAEPAAAWSQGRTMSLDAIVTFVLHPAQNEAPSQVSCDRRTNDTNP